MRPRSGGSGGVQEPGWSRRARVAYVSVTIGLVSGGSKSASSGTASNSRTEFRRSGRAAIRAGFLGSALETTASNAGKLSCPLIGGIVMLPAAERMGNLLHFAVIGPTSLSSVVRLPGAVRPGHLPGLRQLASE